MAESSVARVAESRVVKVAESRVARSSFVAVFT